MAQEMLKIRMKHSLSLNAVAEICRIDVLYVAKMELGIPVDPYYAQRLRSALGEHLRMMLTNDLLPIVLLGDEDRSGVSIGKVR